MKMNKIEARKWEELPIECLVNVFGRVGVESLLVDVPFVCKSWFKATLDPFCWKHLHFPFISPYYDDPFVDRFKSQYGVQGEICETKFVKGIIDRSAGCATIVDLYCCTVEKAVINYVADKCPAMKKLVLCPEDQSFMVVLSLVIGKFRNLKSLDITSLSLFKEIVTEIGSHCENFVALNWDSGPNDWIQIGEEEVMAVVTCLPKIKYLALRGACIKRENLIKILKGCVKLVLLDLNCCCGFEEDDEELSKLASHIPTFDCSGSFIDDDYFV